MAPGSAAETGLITLQADPDQPDGTAGLIRMILASFAPPTTGPATNTKSPDSRELAATRWPSSRTTVLPNRSQVIVLPSGALTVMTDPATDCTVPRSKASVLAPFLVSKVT